MNIKSVLVGLCIALGAGGAFAATRIATFEPVAPGSSRFTLNGFGRAVNTSPVPVASSSFAQRSTSAAAVTLTSAPVFFHDRYQLVGLPPGVFSLDSATPVTWSGSIDIFAVTLSWLDGSTTVPFIDFDVDSAAMTASGSGNFLATCDSCVFLDVYGTEVAGLPGQYGSTFQVTQVSEVQTHGLMLAGLGVLAMWMRRRSALR